MEPPRLLSTVTAPIFSQSSKSNFSGNGNEVVREYFRFFELVVEMTFHRTLSAWSVIEAPGGWAVEDDFGLRLAFVEGKQSNPERLVMSKHEAWQLASCIAALPQILLHRAQACQESSSSSERTDVSLGNLYESFLLH